MSTPLWLGHPSGIAQRVLERLGAELSNTDDAKRPIILGKVAVVAVASTTAAAVGNAAHLAEVLRSAEYPPYQ